MATNNAVNTTLSGQSGTGSFAGTTSPSLTTPRIGQINDSNGNPIFFMSGQASAVNYVYTSNSATTAAVGLGVLGSDADIQLSIGSKGNASLNLTSTSTAIPFIWFSGTGLQHQTRWNISNTSATRDVTLKDASGTLAFLTDVGVTRVVEQVFTSSGTYTPTSGMLYCWVRAVGGGCAGGGAAGNTGQICVGAGGGSGGYSESLISAATIGVSQTVTIGAGGTSGGAAPGNNGGNTSLGALVIANGGTGGGSGTASATFSGAIQGSGGTAGTGDFTSTGTPGTSGFSFTTSAGVAGNGGSSVFGGGATGFIAAAGSNNGNAGVAGGGGSGGVSVGLVNSSGGAGGAGKIIIIEFC